jgi:hypothetical protein
MKELSENLLAVVDAAEARLRAMTPEESARPLRPGGWSPKQVIGHLIDSASNNHQRFVRAALEPELKFPRYDQDGNLRVEVPEKASWLLLVSLWAAYNRYLAHVIAYLPPEKLDTLCRIGEGEPVTLSFLASDYLHHLLHHLAQMSVIKAA